MIEMKKTTFNEKGTDKGGNIPEFLISINKEAGNRIIPWLQNHHYVDSHFKITSIDDCIFIPVKAQKVGKLKQEPYFEQNSLKILDNHNNSIPILQRKPKHEQYKDILLNQIPKELHPIIPRSFDIIGKIAIIELNREDLAPLRPYIRNIGDSILHSNPNIEAVFEKASNIEGVYRLRELEYVSGKNSLETIYKENGCRFLLNVGKTFFTPRLSYERNRISHLETEYNSIGSIWDMFCGIGPFFIQIAKQSPKAEFYATDINPEAINFAQKNIKLNHLSNRIECFEQNVSNIQGSTWYPSMRKNISRIIMNLPEKNLDFIPLIPDFLHPKGCLIHVYQFSNKNDPEQEALLQFKEAISQVDIDLIEILNIRTVKPYSPALDTTVIDAIIRNKEK